MTETSTTSATPTGLSFTRALYAEAKETKIEYWRLEGAAAVAAVVAALLPWPIVAAVFGLMGVGLKWVAKQRLTAARGLYRQAERSRRYDVEGRTLGWPVPPSERADMHRLPKRVQERAARLAAAETTYYSNSSAPSVERFLSNVMESIFWTRCLMDVMGRRRQKQSAVAFLLLIASLVGLALAGLGDVTAVAIKIIGVAVSFFVAVDVFTEGRAFDRGEKELSLLLKALEPEARTPTSSQDEIMRIFIEYNCALADLPMIPDDIYEAQRPVLNRAWAAYEDSLPALAKKTDDD